ncbi:hypothetical protein SETIT_5G397500v2 [Setaria italica]|uniref:Uncharacterized protein n=1 Tax=Setaria italica TaxID=4555 RepID=K3XNL6_SETIT|nr:hypothetical protein SETIT_5G397500v2 [Setaria italica]
MKSPFGLDWPGNETGQERPFPRLHGPEDIPTSSWRGDDAAARHILDGDRLPSSLHPLRRLLPIEEDLSAALRRRLLRMITLMCFNVDAGDVYLLRF